MAILMIVNLIATLYMTFNTYICANIFLPFNSCLLCVINMIFTLLLFGYYLLHFYFANCILNWLLQNITKSYSKFYISFQFYFHLFLQYPFMTMNAWHHPLTSSSTTLNYSPPRSVNFRCMLCWNCTSLNTCCILIR